MPWVRLEPTIPVFERAKTFRALDRAATVIGEIKNGNRFKKITHATIIWLYFLYSVNCNVTAVWNTHFGYESVVCVTTLRVQHRVPRKHEV
jgi:hypothetical protein